MDSLYSYTSGNEARIKCSGHVSVAFSNISGGSPNFETEVAHVKWCKWSQNKDFSIEQRH